MLNGDIWYNRIVEHYTQLIIIHRKANCILNAMQRKWAEDSLSYLFYN